MSFTRPIARRTPGAILVATAALLGGCATGEPETGRNLDTLPTPSVVTDDELIAAPVISSVDTAATVTEPAERDPEPGSEQPVGDIIVTAVQHVDNTLISDVTVQVPTEAPVALDVGSSETDRRRLESTGAATQHEFTVIGLRAETSYTFTATDDTGSSAAVEFTSGPLPANAPEVDVVASSSEPSTEAGITFFGIAPEAGASATDAAYFGVDAEGEVVWYLDTDEAANRDPVVRDVGNGELLVFFADSIQRIRLDGAVVESYDLSAVDGWHHDAIVLDDGGLLALSRENRTVDGTDLRGDTITELDESGDVVWEWSSFDHLDTARFPGALSTAEARAGGIDWTHGNSIFLDTANDEILLSLRSQHWVVNIDLATGEVVWIAGDEDGAAASFDAAFLELTDGSWTSAQHAATWSDDGQLLVYDNRNESVGPSENSRIVGYEVDTGAQTATQSLEYVLPKYTQSLGDVDELANGNLLATAGGPGSSDEAHLVEVDTSGELVWEATLTERIYRSERVPWRDITVGTTPDDTGGGTGSGDAVDITDATLTSMDTNCSAYVGSYSSTVTDVDNGTDFEGELTITADADRCTLASNQIPNHDISLDATFANDTSEVDGTFEITADPDLNASTTPLGFTVNAVMLNGVIWEAYPAACFGEGPDELGREAIGCGPNQLDNPWRYDVGSPLNTFRLDAFSAHAQANGLYHYHSTPEALYDIDCTGVDVSPVIGFARDGFPIHGPCFADGDGAIRAAQSSYELASGTRQDVTGFTTPYTVGNVQSDDYNGQFIGDYRFAVDSGDLDECNGMVVDGEYGYYITGTYPYVLGCYSGTPSTTFGAS